MFLLVLGAAAVALVVAVLVMQTRWDLDTPWDAVRQLVMSTLPLPTLGRDSLRRRVVTWSRNLPMVMPSGARTLPGTGVARMSTATAMKLVPNGDMNLLAEDLARMVQVSAREQKVAVPPGATVFLVLDDQMQTGWVSSSVRYADQTAISWVELSSIDLPPATPARRAPLLGSEGAAGATESSLASPSAPAATLAPTRRLPPPQATEMRERRRTAGAATARPGGPTRAMASLVISDGERTATISDRSALLGRDDACDVVVDHPATSRVHARIDLSKGQFALTDHGSRNGTTVNGAHVGAASPRVLAAGDRIELGSAEATWTVLTVTAGSGAGR